MALIQDDSRENFPRKKKKKKKVKVNHKTNRCHEKVSCEWQKDVKKLNNCIFFLSEVCYVGTGQRCVLLFTVCMLCIPKTDSPNGSNLTHA